MARRKWVSPYRGASTLTAADAVRYFNEVHDAILAVGLVQLASPGQAGSFTTEAPNPGETQITLTGTLHITHGFNVYKLNDSLAGDSPIVIKVVYKSLYYSSTWTPDLEFTVSRSEVGDNPTIPSPHFYDRVTSGGVNSGDTPSFAAAGEGYFWLALKIGAFKPSSGTYGTVSNANYAPRPLAEPVGFPTIVFGVFRSVDETGSITGGAFTVVDQGYLYYTSGGFYSEYVGGYTFRHSGLDGVVRASKKISSGIQADCLPTLGGKPAVSRCYGVASVSSQNPLVGIATVQATQLQDGDETDIALFGTNTRPMVFPGRGLAPMEPNSVVIPGRNPASSVYAEYVAPLLAWDGPDV